MTARAELPAVRDVGDVIQRSRSLASADRLAIYANAYFARLMEILENDFPAVKHAAGVDAFRQFCWEYLRQHPSRSDTLADLGRALPEFLARTRPPRTSETSGPDWADFLAELARLERIYSEVFDGPGVEGTRLMRPEDLAELTPEEWLSARLSVAPCLRLATFSFPVHEYASAVRCGQGPAWPEPREIHLVISRRDYVVRRKVAGPEEFAVLSSLVAGQTIAESLEAAVAAHPDEFDGLLSVLRTWFCEWSAAGYFIGMQRVGRDSSS